MTACSCKSRTTGVGSDFLVILEISCGTMGAEVVFVILAVSLACSSLASFNP